jgi:hypothetical protein
MESPLPTVYAQPSRAVTLRRPNWLRRLNTGFWFSGSFDSLILGVSGLLSGSGSVGFSVPYLQESFRDYSAISSMKGQ